MYTESTLILQGTVYRITVLNKIKQFQSIATSAGKEEKQNLFLGGRLEERSWYSMNLFKRKEGGLS